MTRGVGVFLATAFGLAWASWAWLLWHGWQPGEASMRLLVVQGAFAPALGAAAARCLAEHPRQNDAGLGLRPGHWRLYLLALLWPLAGAALVLALGQLLGLASVDWSLASGLDGLPEAERRAALELLGGRTWSLWGLNLFQAVAATPILFGEEFGWRGYLQQRIFTDRPLAAAVVTGVVWSLWHLPLNLAGYNFPGSPLLGMTTFTASCVLLSIILGWLRRASGSVWCASLGHAAVNALGASVVLLAVGPEGRGGLLVQFLGVLGWVPMGLLAGWIVCSGRLWRDVA